ncbi:GGDEF domain-containing protein [Acidovorax sp. SUPP2522]|uniref:GGDEF domain-containing protein n=2 Tax=unclassified Acidovorax TaxID=2684926 RepID=UPI0023DE24B1|nr:GGDEF domain-containing protein [Acidovorax sp. SUPP2522]WCM98495.1 GGDEF domain-containing protein [Acidovorax sp. GBBC 1281]GKT13985.1 GGDEF domain-containing protein [Acidovorax sp. SUPP2522]
MRLDFVTLMAITATNLCMLSAALPLIMGRGAGTAARWVQASLLLQGLAWAAIIASSYAWDQTLSTVSMAANSLAQWALFEALAIWLGPRPGRRLVQALVVAIPLGYTLGFSHYAFRVGWANLLLATLLLAVARATLYPAHPAHFADRRWRLLLMGCLATMAAFTAARGVLGAFTDAYPSFRTPHPVNIAAAVAANVTLVLGTVAVLVAWRDEAEQQLRTLAMTDPLTGLLNRRGFESHGQALRQRAARQRLPLAALLLDLDHFKRINDAYGHEAGDRALAWFARLAQSMAGPHDTVCRFGGEEFGVLLLHAQQEEAQRFDQRLRERLQAESAQALGFPIDYSAGAALWHGGGEDLAELMARADAALYAAKEQGRRQLAMG